MSAGARPVANLAGALEGEPMIWLVIAAALILLVALLVSLTFALTASVRRRRAEADRFDPAEDAGSAAASAARIRERRRNPGEDPVLAALGIDRTADGGGD